MSDVPRDSERDEAVKPGEPEEIEAKKVEFEPIDEDLDPDDDPGAYYDDEEVLVGNGEQYPETGPGDDAPDLTGFGAQPAAQDSEQDAAQDESGDDTGGGAGDGGGDGGDDGDGGDGADEDPDEADGRDLREMTLLDHMEELRVRMTRVVIGCIVGFLACYAFSQQMFDMLVLPLVTVLPEGSSLIFTALPEAFFTYLKVSFVAGVFVSSPYSFYQIWAFVAPGLYEDERKWLIPLALISAIFFVSGAMFGYFVVFPFAFQFFMDFGTELIKPMPSLKEYLSFSLKLLFAFGLTFELPLFIFFLARLGIVDAPLLRRIRKYAILGAFIFSAILTPPDVVSQVLMAGPIIVLYEASIFVALIFGKKRKKAQEEDEESETAEQDSDEAANTGDEEKA